MAVFWSTEKAQTVYPIILYTERIKWTGKASLEDKLLYHIEGISLLSFIEQIIYQVIVPGLNIHVLERFIVSHE